MKGVPMMCKIKSKQESGLSIRATSRELNLSKNTVHKYYNMSQDSIDSYRSNYTRKSQFDIALTLIEEKLSNDEDLSATNLFRSVKESHPDITAEIRAFRNYIHPIRLKYKELKQHRIYTPVIYTAKECKVQADFGEFKMPNATKISGKLTTLIYFLSFVFSHSTTRFVVYQTRHFNTNDSLVAHKKFFRFIGGVPKEIAYDQTKLVVIDEEYGEVDFNKKFDQFRQKCGFRPYVCAKNSPESKGKIEQTVGYVKREFLKGREFHDLEALNKENLIWLSEVNAKQHDNKQKSRHDMFLEEKEYFVSKQFPMQLEERKVDKVGLISFEGNKYSVPYEYQRKIVAVNSEASYLYLYDRDTLAQLAQHNIPLSKGETVINYAHYPCKIEKLENLRIKAHEALSDIDFGEVLVNRLISDNPDIAGKQVRGLLTLATKYEPIHWNSIKSSLLRLPEIRYSLIKELLRVSELRIANKNFGSVAYQSSTAASLCTEQPTFSVIDRDLKIYNKGIKNVITN
jgi:transposase